MAPDEDQIALDVEKATRIRANVHVLCCPTILPAETAALVRKRFGAKGNPPADRISAHDDRLIASLDGSDWVASLHTVAQATFAEGRQEPSAIFRRPTQQRGQSCSSRPTML